MVMNKLRIVKNKVSGQYKIQRKILWYWLDCYDGWSTSSLVYMKSVRDDMILQEIESNKKNWEPI